MVIGISLEMGNRFFVELIYKIIEKKKKSDLINIRLKMPLNRQINISFQKVTSTDHQKGSIVVYSDSCSIRHAVVQASSSPVSDS